MDIGGGIGWVGGVKGTFTSLSSVPWLRACICGRCVVALVLGAAVLRAAETGAPKLPAFIPVSWFPATSQALRADGVATDRLVLAKEGQAPGLDDQVTFLVEEIAKGRARQWAMVLKYNTLKPNERALRTSPLSMYASTGVRVDFPPSPVVGMAIHVFGPYERNGPSPAAKSIWSGAFINPEFMGLGFDQSAVLFRRLVAYKDRHQETGGGGYSLGFRSNPFPEADVQKNRIALAKFGITPGEYRAFAGFVPALINFFVVGSQTPGVRERILDVVDVPWLSLVMHGGKLDDVDFEILGGFEKGRASDWGLPDGQDVYYIGLRGLIYGKPAVLVRLAVTRPRVPLFNCAGIVGLAAVRPDGKGPLVTIRAMASRPAANLATR